MAENRIMTHLVAGYPTMNISKNIAMAMIAGGTAYLEIQFPFSDPIADGPLIQGACTESIENGFTQEQGFAMIKEISLKTDVPVFLMTYANLVMAVGVKEFVRKSCSAGVAGLIIPDLPFDYDEDLYPVCRDMNIPVIPVLVQGISEMRLEKIRALKPEFIYAAIRKGITGQKSSIDDNTISFLNRISQSGIKILAGFGIREKDQVDLLSPHVHCAVIGSALVEIIKDSFEKNKDIFAEVENFVSSLI